LLSPSQPTAALRARSPNSRAPARDALASDAESAAEESLSAHAKRALRTRVSAAAAAALDAGIASLQRLRKQAGGTQEAEGAADEDRPRQRNDRPGARCDAAAPAAEADPPAPRRRLRGFLIHFSVLLAGSMGGGALAYNLLATLLDRQSAESRRLEATLEKHLKSAATAREALEQAQAKRIEAEKKLEASAADYANSSAEKQKKLDEAENRLGTLLATERARNPPQPSPVRRASAGGKALPVKTGNCKVEGSNIAALKDCINDFYR
jgi:hypothetical protein